MAVDQYRLRCSVVAHASDIRAVVSALDPVGGIITGSRDKTVKVFLPLSNNNGFVEAYCMRGASHFISSLCAIPPSEQYPGGLILAGSSDCAIYGFSLDSPEPVLKLLGHSGNVCALVAGNNGTVVSGSWDKTARLWFGEKCVATLTGHGEAVWAVALLPDHTLVLTGSADKTICLWRKDKCESKFVGHEDCVRGLALISDSEFLSCSNDTTIRRWKISGSCMGVYWGHTDYIYDICTSSCGNYFFSCGEDQTVKVWKENMCVQTINFPAKSLWAVTCLKNSDIAVGGSDGTVRIFTKHESRRASPAEEATFNEEVKKSSQKKNIEALEPNGIPGTEALFQNGTSDEQTQLCKVGDEVFAFQWSVKENKWQKLGKVLNALEGKESKEKTAYEGKEYDYVFTVEVDDGKLLKLPYNDTDDPWLVAHKFIEQHKLSSMFLDQIASFIVQNSNPARKRAENEPEFSDPFTGGGRYIPSSLEKSLPVANSAGDNSLEGHPTGNTEKNQSEAYFPLFAYITFDNANTTGIKAKLCEFTEKVERIQRLTEEEIENMLLLSSCPEEITDRQMLSLEKALSWPNDLVFPALDVLRLAVRGKSVNTRVSKDGGIGLINHLLNFLSNDNPASNQMLVLRTFSNFFTHSPGEQLVVEQATKILNLSRSLCSSENKHVQIALSTLYANFSVFFLESDKPEYAHCKDICVLDAVHALGRFREPEAVLRLLACIGTAVHDKKCLLLAQTLRVVEIVKSVMESSDAPKVKDFCSILIQLVTRGI